MWYASGRTEANVCCDHCDLWRASEINGAQGDTTRRQRHRRRFSLLRVCVTFSQRSVSVRLRDVSRDGKRRHENMVLMTPLCTGWAQRRKQNV